MAGGAAGRRVLIDVAVAHAVSGSAGRWARAAQEDGAMAYAEEGSKRSKYKNAAGLVPFVLETGGRVGPAARALARRAAPTGAEERTQALGSLWQTLSVMLQKRNAIMVHDMGKK
eukprot:9061672-Alexandrium_andersonii.AAC.1